MASENRGISEKYVCSSPLNALGSVPHLIREVGQVVDNLSRAPQNVVQFHKTIHCLSVPTAVTQEMYCVSYRANQPITH